LDLPELTEEQIGELKRAFDLFDSKGKGRIQPQEMVKTMENSRLTVIDEACILWLSL
jgi:Ca2+-binding EF-hand superfamily protein